MSVEARTLESVEDGTVEKVLQLLLPVQSIATSTTSSMPKSTTTLDNSLVTASVVAVGGNALPQSTKSEKPGIERDEAVTEPYQNSNTLDESCKFKPSNIRSNDSIGTPGCHALEIEEEKNHE